MQYALSDVVDLGIEVAVQALGIAVVLAGIFDGFFRRFINHHAVRNMQAWAIERAEKFYPAVLRSSINESVTFALRQDLRGRIHVKGPSPLAMLGLRDGSEKYALDSGQLCAQIARIMIAAAEAEPIPNDLALLLCDRVPSKKERAAILSISESGTSDSDDSTGGLEPRRVVMTTIDRAIDDYQTLARSVENTMTHAFALAMAGMTAMMTVSLAAISAGTEPTLSQYIDKLFMVPVVLFGAVLLKRLFRRVLGP